jgi:Domain of unknown function (DUF4157)
MVPLRGHEEKSDQGARRGGAAGKRPVSRARTTASPVTAPRTAIGAGAGDRSPASIMALQRSVGNAAVVQLLAAEQHGHDPSCGHRSAQLTSGTREAPEAGPGESAPVQRRSSVDDMEAAEAGPGGSTSVQRRSSVHEVLSSSGQPIPGPLLNEMQWRHGGADFSTVRLHDDAKAQRSAAEIGAHAYTSGEDIVRGKGGFDKKTLAHELKHVLQQRSGPVAGTPTGDGLTMSSKDDVHEREAEASAADVMSAPVPVQSAPQDQTAGEGGGGQGTAPSAPAVQRLLTVAGRDYSKEFANSSRDQPLYGQQVLLDRLVASLDQQMVKEAAPVFTAPERALFLREKDRIMWQLKKAIVAPMGEKRYHPILRRKVGAHPDFGAKNHDIRVKDVNELARGLMGWVYAKDKRRTEKEVAFGIQREAKISVFLDAVLTRINIKIGALKTGLTPRQAYVMHQELTTNLSHLESQPLVRDPRTGGVYYDPSRAGERTGAYEKHFDGSHGKFAGHKLGTDLNQAGGMQAVLSNPESYTFREKMMVLHDLTDYFGPGGHTPPTMGTKLSEKMTRAEESDTRSTAGVDPHGRRVVVQDRGQNPGVMLADGTIGKHPSTRNEHSDTTKYARAKNVPVWAGQSFTAARMFRLAQNSGASTDEIAAIAWGIFSYWRVDFDHATDYAYHTLHEVMDIAQNFGVPYDIDHQYAQLSTVNVAKIHQSISALSGTVSMHLGKNSGELDGLERMAADRRVRWTDSMEYLLVTVRGADRQLRKMRADLDRCLAGLATWAGKTQPQRTGVMLDCLDTLRLIDLGLRNLAKKLVDARG